MLHDRVGKSSRRQILKRLSALEFAQLAHKRYQEQLAEPRFHALLKHMGPGRVHAICGPYAMTRSGS